MSAPGKRDGPRVHGPATTIGGQVTFTNTKRALCSAVIAAAAVTLLDPQQGSLPSEFLTALVGVGAPVAVGMMAVDYLDSDQAYQPLQRSAMAGALAITLLMAGGLIPFQFDAGTAVTFGIMAASAFVGDAVSNPK